MGQSAFVTGGTGFVGAHLVRQLLDRGWTVTALVRETSSRRDLEGLDVRYAVGDVTDRPSVEAAMAQDVDAVFHVAASTNIWSRGNAEQNRINIGGTENVVATAVARRAKRFVHTSSFIVWGFHDGTIDETTPWTPGDEWINYLRTKRIAERRVKAAVEAGELDAVICNPAHILGPGDRHNWSRMIRMVHTGKLPGIPPGGGAFADVREVAKAHIEACLRGERGANYLLGGEEVAFQDLVAKVGETLERPVPKRASPAWQLKLVGRVSAGIAALTGKAPDITPEGAAMIVRHIHCDSSRAREALGYGFTPIGDLVRDTCDWMRREGMLA